MNSKSFISGLLAAYGVILLFSAFGVSLLVSLPINAFGVNVGTIVVATISLGLAYYVSR